MTHCNLDFIKSINPGSNTFTIKVIKLFLNETPKHIKQLKFEIANANWGKVYEHTHKIKPSVLMLGFPTDMTEALLNILKYSQSRKNTDQIYNLFKAFETKISSIYYELDQELKKLEK